MITSVTDLIWPIVRLWLDGMSREEAIACIAKKHGIDQEELLERLL